MTEEMEFYTKRVVTEHKERLEIDKNELDPYLYINHKRNKEWFATGQLQCLLKLNMISLEEFFKLQNDVLGWKE